ncbi:MAG: cation diffusion facilitator family transporter [Gammaproteobacteria bacterium]
MSEGSSKSVYAALIGNVLIAVTKFVAASISGSSAMLSEGIHSLVDSLNEVLLLYGMRRSRKPANAQFPFGRGKEIYFWSFVVALLVFALGAGVSFYEGVRHLRHPSAMSDARLNYIVIGLSLVFEGLSWRVAFREFRQQQGRLGLLEAIRRAKDPTVFTVLLEDSAALLGLVVALAGIALGQWTGNPVFDGGASIVIGLILASVAILLARECKGLLIGESADRDVVEGIRALIEGNPDVDRVHEILSMHMGPDFILVNISLHVKSEADRADVRQVFRLIDETIKARFPKVKRIFIESRYEAAAPPAGP